MKRCNVFVYIINKTSLRSWLCIIRIVLSSLLFLYCSLRDHIMCKALYNIYKRKSHTFCQFSSFSNRYSSSLAGIAERGAIKKKLLHALKKRNKKMHVTNNGKIPHRWNDRGKQRNSLVSGMNTCNKVRCR